MELIRPFEQLGKNDARIAGGKGASLGELTQAGIPVPPGFVVLTHAFERFLDEANLNQELDAIFHSVNHQEIGTVEKASERIQSLIIAAQMPQDIADEILAMFAKLDTTYVAVRSSATAEDGANAAWAGQLDTFLNTTEETLLENVQKCWASLFTPRAIFYRFEKGMHGSKISVAVVVQKMVQSEVSGIAFSVHPVTEDYNQLIIEGGFGLGEAIVSGQVTPDSFVVEKQPRRIIDKSITFQSRALWRAESGGNEWRELSETEGNKPALSDPQVMELAEIVLHIEQHYGFPCDIEWAFEAGTFYITQSRPITTLSPRSEVPAPVASKEKWHYWGQWKSPLLVNSPYSVFVESRIVSEWPLLQRIQGDQVTYDGHFFTLTSDLACIEAEVIEALEGRSDFFKTHLQHCEREEKELLALEGRDDIEKFLLQMINVVGCSMTAQYVGQISRKYMREKCLRQNITEADVLAAISMPGETRHEQYEKELELLHDTDIDDFVKRYIWIDSYLYEGESLTAEKVREQRTRGRQHSDIVPSTAPNGFDAFIRGASQCAYWRTRNAETMNKVTYSYRHHFKQLAEKHHIPYEKLIQLTHRELIALWNGSPVPANILDRSAEWGIEYIEGNLQVVPADQAANELNDMPLPKVKSATDVEGTVAYKGVVRGIARVVRTNQETYNVREGDIIIANETTPDYIGAMKLAAAFVTNQGGITSHAAIIAREMKKPCIVGTNVATQVFKDGDLVEVDADNGIVRKIS